MKRCSTSLAWRDIQIGQDEKTPPIHSDEGQLQRPTMGEGNQNPGALLGGVDSDASTCGKHPGTSSKLNTGSPHAPAVQFPGIYSKKLKTGVQKKKKKTPYTHSQQHYSQYPKGGGNSRPLTSRNTVKPTHTWTTVQPQKEPNIETCYRITLKTAKFMAMCIVPQ